MPEPSESARDRAIEIIAERIFSGTDLAMGPAIRVAADIVDRLPKPLREQAEIEQLAEVAKQQQTRSRAPDYWEGVEDALAWLQGETIPQFDPRLLATMQGPNTADLKASMARHPAGSQLHKDE